MVVSLERKISFDDKKTTLFVHPIDLNKGWCKAVQTLFTMIHDDGKTEREDLLYHVKIIYKTVGRARQVIYESQKKYDLLNNNIHFIEERIDKLCKMINQGEKHQKLLILMNSDIFNALIPETAESLKSDNQENVSFFRKISEKIVDKFPMRVTEYIEKDLKNWITLVYLSVIEREDQDTLRQVPQFPKKIRNIVVKGFKVKEELNDLSFSTSDLHSLIKCISNESELPAHNKVEKIWKGKYQPLINQASASNYEKNVRKIFATYLKYIEPLLPEDPHLKE